MFALRPSGLHAVPASRTALRGAPVEALQQSLGAAQVGTVEHGPSLPDHPVPGEPAKAATTARASAKAASEGEKAALMIGT